MDSQARGQSQRRVWWSIVPVLLLVGALLGGFGSGLLASNETQTANPLPFTMGFEDGDLRGWTVSGQAFANQPTLGDNCAARGREPSNHQGDWWIGGYEDYQGKPGQSAGDVKGDEFTGTLTSAPFVIEESGLSFLIGGGNHPVGDPTGATVVALVIDGEVVLHATGADTETMRRVEWDVSKYFSETAAIQLIDENSGDWGHVNFDDLRITVPEALYTDDFQTGVAADLLLDPGWEVYQDRDGSYVLRGEGMWQWATLDQGYTWWSDYEVRFRLKLIRGGVQFNCRLNLPFAARTRYLVGFRESEMWVGRETPYNTYRTIAAREADLELDKWYSVKVIASGASFKVLVDGETQLEVENDDPILQGSIAFETLEAIAGSYETGSLVYVDDIVVLPLGESDQERTAPTWVRTGGPFGGIGYDIRMRPDNPDIMYVTDAYAGVFMSVDGGQSWFPSNRGISSRSGLSSDTIPAFSLTIDPHDYDIVWTGMRNLGGIYKSTDAGRTWKRMDHGVSERVGLGYRGFTVDPRSSDIVYAAAEITSWGWYGQQLTGREFDISKGIIYKTTDGGENWRAVWRGDNVVRYVWIDPRDPEVVYASTGFFDVEAANSDPILGMPGGEGILKSIDGGETWFRVNDGLGNLYVGSLFMHPEDPDILLAGTGNNQYWHHGGVYISTDAGATWEHVLGEPGGYPGYWYIITAVEFAAADPRIAYAGSAVSIFRSEDGGHTWRMVSGGTRRWGPESTTAGIPIDFEIDPGDPDRVFVNCYGGGNFLSTDGGRTWRDVSNGYTGAEARDIAVHPSDPQQVLVAGRSGVFRSDDGGDSWIPVASPAESLEWNVAAIDPANPEHFLIGSNSWRGIFESFGPGSHPQIVAPDVWTTTSRGFGWRAIAFAPSRPAVVYAGTGAFVSSGFFSDFLPAKGVFRSNDGGSTWAPANDPLSGDAHVAALAVDLSNPLVAYAATTNLGLLKTTDGGLSWTASNEGLPSGVALLSVACHPADPAAIFVGLDRAGIYRSSDGGASWSPVSAGLNPESIISSIVIDPAHPDILFASDRMSGVYNSSDGGSTWRLFSKGLQMRDVNALAIASDGTVLYAATEGGGVYRLDLTDEEE